MLVNNLRKITLGTNWPMNIRRIGRGYVWTLFWSRCESLDQTKGNQARKCTDIQLTIMP